MMRNQFCFSHTGAILLLEEINGTNLGPHFTIAEEMDWDRNGMVNFKEFLFAFTNWVGIDDNEDEEDWSMYANSPVSSSLLDESWWPGADIHRRESSYIYKLLFVSSINDQNTFYVLLARKKSFSFYALLCKLGF